MSLFRIVVAAGLLFAFAPEQTLKVARTALGLADEARQLQVNASEQAMTYCKDNPVKCMDMAKQAAEVSEGVTGKLQKR
jgi:hypothetical protein